MTEAPGTAPPGHFLTRCTTDKLCRYLDMAAQQDLSVVATAFIGGRDWIIVTQYAPILGPAASRVLTLNQE